MFGRVAGDQCGVDGADRRADHPIGLDAGCVQCLVHTDLVGAECAAALEDQHDLTWQRGSLVGGSAIAARGCYVA